MFHKPFWTFLLISVLLALYAFRARKFKLIDVQVIFMVIAVSMSLDMLLCKQYNLYNYVNETNKGWYSFWANFVMVPSLAIVYIKFIPSRPGKLSLYILLWSIGCTLLELFVLKPAEIIFYHGWNPFPHSFIGYVVVLIWECVYYRLLEKHSIKSRRQQTDTN